MLAGQLLKAWAARPLVTAVTLNVKDGKIEVRESQQSKVTPGRAPSGIAWTQLDEALPLPFLQWGTMWGGGPTVPLVISSSDLTESLNEEPLRVTGLKRGVYGLRIDGQKMGTFSSESLATGINLATMQTPMTDQAFQVYQAIVQFNDVHFDRFKHVQVALDPDKMPEAERAARAMDEVDAAIQKKARALASAKPHSFELVPVT